jgi:signal transduction histidine kinase
LEEFANIVSHDLRNPLAVAQGHLGLARETDRERSFDAVADALDQMEHLIDDLLSLARQGEVVGETDVVDAGAVARRAWDTVETGAATLEIDSTTVEADEQRLAELFGNLFRNSVEHGSTDNRPSSGGSVEHGARRASGRSALGDSAEHDSTSGRAASDDGVTVAVAVGALDGERGFYVEDDGPGIEEDRRDEVFDPGETTGDDGIGYGLAIVSRIAEAHGWDVSVTDSDDGGARFEFRTERA